MKGIIEGLLYVQGDLGLTINQVADILEITTEEAKLKEPITEDMDYSRHNLSIFSFLSLCSILSTKSKYMLRNHITDENLMKDTMLLAWLALLKLCFLKILCGRDKPEAAPVTS